MLLLIFAIDFSIFIYIYIIYIQIYIYINIDIVLIFPGIERIHFDFVRYQHTQDWILILIGCVLVPVTLYVDIVHMNL